MDAGGQLFRRVVEASRDGLWILDDDRRTVHTNLRMAGLLGRAPEELVGLPAAEYLSLDLDQLVTGTADEGADNVEAELVRADGTTVWVLVNHSPLRDDEGGRLGWLLRVTDNTQQKALLEALQERERLLAAAQSIARIGSWEWDVASNLVTWSEQLYRIYNVSPDEFAATYEAFLDFVHPEDRPIVEAAVGSVFAGEDEFAWDARVIPRGGSLRWVRGLGRVERDAEGNPVRMGGTAQDITERVTADEMAAAATRRLGLLQTMATAANQTNGLDEALELAEAGLPVYTDWLPLGVFRANESGRVELSKTFHQPDGTPHPDLALAQECWRAAEFRHTPAPGREATHSLVAIPVVVDAQTTCVIELVADETPPSKDAAELLEQISAQLSQVAQREAGARRLAAARDEAMEASRLKSEFLATMSHEIRTPMNGVIGLNDLLLRTELDPHQRRLAIGLQGAGLTLLGIINDILDLSKVEAGKLELEEVDFDVRTVFDKCADVLSGPAHDKGVELVVACHPDVPAALRGDPGRLGQVLANLGSNAVKFTDAGEVSIRAYMESSSPGAVVLRVDVTDTGVGIEPDLLPRLFDAFTQADRSTTREHGGTGLGLAISEQLVGALGGTIEVTSELGRGSVFSFTARLARSTGHGLRRPHTGDAGLLRGRRILVVDDNATNRLILHEQLTAWGMSPVVVGSSDEALAAVRRATAAGEPFEVAVLDLLLPDGDGVALARAITAGTPAASPQLLLLSSGQVDLPAARAAGIVRTLTKPVRHSDLFDSLVDAMASGPDVDPSSSAAPAAEPRGRRVLVVEDNQVNQMVAVGLLEAAGYAVDVVDDGEQAVESLAPGHPYAAVLMDCRMPRVDGFDATRQIRSREPARERVPIIAMTASALEGEEERCRDAGMDDFLTKPVDPVRMLRVVGGWVDERASAASTDEAPGSGEEDLSDIVDLERMQMLDELVKDGVSMFERASAHFATEAPRSVADLRAALGSGDAETVTAVAHKLKGSALTLGLPMVSAAAETLELMGISGSLEGGEAAVTALRDASDRALSVLAGLRSGEL